MNRLADATSPYLLQHAANPVDWWPWGPEALAEAAAREVPILLSVGYAACHWCHVMAHESFEDGEVAEFVNAHFVPVKVDREERPDIDAVYMKATQALTGQGGWPNTLFLTPDGRPFFAGTYYPPYRRGGMPSFLEVCTALAGAWEARRDEVLDSAEAIRGHLAAELAVPEPQDRLDVWAALASLRDDFDPVHGGFGGAPKFPPPLVLDALLVKGEPAGLDIAQRTLEAMARGGIHDQLGGGFHRYSVDAGWVVPHFEKMLYDNALLLGSYVRGWRRTPDHEPVLRTLFERVVRGIVGWLERELATDGGALAASLDADSVDVRGSVHEGIFYVWTPDLVNEVLGAEDGDWAATVFHVTNAGTFEHGLSTLQLRGTPDWRRLDDVRDRLLHARSHRFRPARDDKVVAAWNGLAVDSLVQAALVFGERDWLDLARRVGEALWRDLVTDGRIARTAVAGIRGDVPGTLEDYAAVALGMARLAGATGDATWLKRALGLIETALGLFEAQDGGFFDTSSDAEALLLRPRELTDNPTPSGTSVMIAALRLAGLLADRPELIERADRAAATVRPYAAAVPRFAGWALADDLVADDARKGLAPAVCVVVDDDPLGVLTRAAWRMAPAGTALITAPAGTSGFAHHFDERTPPEPTAYVCRGTVCFEPATTVEQLRAALWSRC